MNDLISRAVMLEMLGYFNDYVNGDSHFLNGIETAKEITENLPAVDAVPVEWLREFDLYYAGISGGTKYMNELVKAWQLEQEAQDGRRTEGQRWMN